jgi:hypothetical protein
MAFNSAPFWLFCAAVIGLHWAVPPARRWAWLLGASWAFYGSFGLPVLGVLAGLTAAVYAAAIAMERAEGRPRTALLAAAIGVPLAALVA